MKVGKELPKGEKQMFPLLSLGIDQEAIQGPWNWFWNDFIHCGMNVAAFINLAESVECESLRTQDDQNVFFQNWFSLILRVMKKG